MGCWGFVKIGFQSSVCRWRRRLRFIVSVRRRISGETGTTFGEFVGPAGRLFGAQHPPDLGLWFGPDQVTGSTPNSGRRQCRSHSRVSEKNFTFFFIGFSYFLQSISSSPACRNDQGDPVNSLEFLVSDVRRDGNGSIYHVGATMMTWLLDNNPKVKNKNDSHPWLSGNVIIIFKKCLMSSECQHLHAVGKGFHPSNAAQQPDHPRRRPFVFVGIEQVYI